MGDNFLRKLGEEEAKERRLEKVSHKPVYSKFSQQELTTWKPLLTPTWVVAMFLIVGVVFIPTGIVTWFASRSVVEVAYNYETTCIMKYSSSTMPLATNEDKSAFMQGYNKRKNCTVSLAIPKTMRQPIYVYYQLSNYFQNHRMYVKSRSDKQLRGGDVSRSDLNNCKPEDLVNGLPVVPCGLIAWSLFNDTFDFSTDGTDNGTIFVNKTGISWKSDREERFNNTVFPSNFPNNNRTTVANASQIGGAWLNESVPLSANEDLIVWMRTAALPTFRKLWGRIETDLQPGNITVNINNFYNTYGFGGKKTLVLSTTSWLGGKNNFLGFAYLVVGSLCIVIGFLFSFVHWRYPRPLGDTSYLSWNQKAAIITPSPTITS